MKTSQKDCCQLKEFCNVMIVVIFCFAESYPSNVFHTLDASSKRNLVDSKLSTLFIIHVNCSNLLFTVNVC